MEPLWKVYGVRPSFCQRIITFEQFDLKHLTFGTMLAQQYLQTWTL